jgi:transposase
MRWSDTQKKPAPRDLTVDEIRSLRRDGLLVVDIAQKFGVSIDVVQQKMDASRMRYL